jgi:hypothetical protein
MRFGPYATVSMAAALGASVSVAGRTFRGIVNFYRTEIIFVHRIIKRRKYVSCIFHILI